MKLNTIAFFAAFTACVVSPCLASAESQDPILSGVYAVNESDDCTDGGSHHIGSIQFNPQDGSMAQHLIFVENMFIKGHNKLAFQELNLPTGIYSLTKSHLTMDKVHYRVVVSAENNGVATYASYIGISQGKNLQSCTLIGTLLRQ